MSEKEIELQEEIERLRNSLLDTLGDVLDAKHILSTQFKVEQNNFILMFNDFINNYTHTRKELEQ